MLDFVEKGVMHGKNGIVIFPDFSVIRSKDLMTRGNDFYAIWDEEAGLWSTDEQTAIRLIDKQLDSYAQEYRTLGEEPTVWYLRRARTKQIDEFHKLCKQQMRENFHQLDSKLTFANTEVKKTDYVSKKLKYPLQSGSTESWDKITSVLYSPEEKMKIEWTIGAIVSGDSKKIQKFVVLYGNRGTGKSTIIDIMDLLFEGYTAPFDAKALGSRNASFSLEPFKDNPLVAIQHDGNLSKIDDNTTLNSLVSHETLSVNTKYHSLFSTKFNTFLILASNNPVKITDSKSGLLRRVIDITPTGKLIPNEEYNRLKDAVKYELGAIAYKCLNIYKKNKHFYDDYIPLRMLSATNDFYGWMQDRYFIFKHEDSVTLTSAYKSYKAWCEDSNVTPYSKTVFTEELKSYFREYKTRDTLDDGTIVIGRYLGFKSEIFDVPKSKSRAKASNWIQLKSQPSVLDIYYKDCKAQYASSEGKPCSAWSNVTSTLSKIRTSELHYLRAPSTDIFLDFDIRDEDGNKSLEANLKAASVFPKTYAEVSKSGEGLHLHYIYDGDVNDLANEISEGIEIKKCTGKNSIRRKLTLCNDIPIAHISSGLPLKEVRNMATFDGFKSEQSLRSMINRNLRKEVTPHTKPSIDFIYNDLENAYNSGLTYDVSDMRNAVIAFALNSSNQASNCLDIVYKMKFKSDDTDEETPGISGYSDERICIFDLEVYPNLFVLCYKFVDDDNITSLINPSSEIVESLLSLKLVGFNNRRYDNHILYARSMGYSNEALYKLSQQLVSSKKGKSDCYFRDAYNLSYTDIYDFCSKKQSLKKWEIELNIHHQEMGLDWNEPVPEDKWKDVVEYCENDVVATEAVWKKNQADFKAREILATIAGGIPNDTTNTLTTRFIFGNIRNPQNEFNYYFMGLDEVVDTTKWLKNVPAMDCDWNYTVFDNEGRARFPGYTFEKREKPIVVDDPELEESGYLNTKTVEKYKSVYRGVEIGEGGYVYASPGMYYNVVTFDVASMHPSSIIALNLFGSYTERFADIVKMRVLIKHGNFEEAKKMFGGKLAQYLDDEDSASALAQALKIAINSVYGLTAAKFENAFRDPRNLDNIVAKRGALFMRNLQCELERKGIKVIHIKTDSIKIADPTPETQQFIIDYGKLYGYNFEIEAEYERFCLVNRAVYIARYKKAHKDKKTGKEIWWTATGKQFAVPYVFKTLFSHEDIDFYDMAETFSVTTNINIDYSEDNSNMQFVGRVGQFTPVTIGGGRLMRKESDGRFSNVGGAKGYKWLESEIAKPLIEQRKEYIDISYYDKLVADAKTAIEQFGSFEKFVEV